VAGGGLPPGPAGRLTTQTRQDLTSARDERVRHGPHPLSVAGWTG
jgi:hypothetical protein